MSALWPYAPLGGVAQITLGKMVRPVATETEFIEQPYLHAANIRDGGVLNTDHSHRTMWFSPEETLRLNLSAGDVVMAEGGAVGKSAYVADDLEGYGFQNSILRIRAQKDKAEGKFIQYCLQSSFDQGEISRECSTVSIAHFPAEKANRFRIPFPPIETQRCIADYLDRETAEIDAAVADLDRYVDQLEKRRRAVVYEALAFKKGPGSGTQISDPQRGRVGFVARLLRRGISPDYVDDGMPVINQKCIRPGGFLAMDNCRFHDLDARGINSNLTIQPGDTLINSTGTGTLGRSCMVREAAVPTTWDSHVTLVRPDTDIVDPVYLGWTILSQESKLIKFSAGSTNQIELSRDTVFNLDFVNIPLILQREIAAYLDRETAEIDSLIADSTSLRDLLLKRRSVLITEVVTGRKQV